MDVDFVQEILYSDESDKIYALESNEIDESSETFISGWSQDQAQDLWVNALTADLSRVAAYDPRPVGDKTVPEMVETRHFNLKTNSWSVSKDIHAAPHIPPPSAKLSALEVASLDPGQNGVDYRPHLFDSQLNKFILIDSGSQCSAFPPEPGDVELKNVHLKAVNGTKIKCYGKSQIAVKMNRKVIHYEVYKADVESPILGWDFVRKNKLDLVWSEFGDLFLEDKKSDIKTLLHYKPLPVEQSTRLQSLTFVDESVRSRRSSPDVIQAQVSAMLDLGAQPEQNLTTLTEGPYKKLLKKIPRSSEAKFRRKFFKNWRVAQN